MNQLRLYLLCLSALLISSYSTAQTPKIRTHHLKFDLDFDYFNTEENFDDGGTFDSLGAGRSYKYYRFDFKSTYAFSKKLSVWGGMDLVAAESVNTDFTRNNTAINDIKFGARYKLFRSRRFQLIADGTFAYPFFNIDDSTDEALVGEGAMVIEPGAWGILRLSQLRLYSFLGYAYRDGGRASLLDWKLGASYRIKPIRFGGELYGFSSIGKDENTDNPSVRTAVTSRANASSLKFYSVDPSLMAFKLWGEWPISKAFAVKLGYSFDMNGQNYAKGSTISLGASWNISLASHKEDHDVFNRRSREDTDNFSIDAQQYDEELFQERRKKKRKVRKKRRTKKPKKKIKQKSNKQILDEAEDFLE